MLRFTMDALWKNYSLGVFVVKSHQSTFTTENTRNVIC